MQHPFQCVTTLPPSEHNSQYLIVVCGPKLLSVCLESGEIVSQWTGEDVTQAQVAATSTMGNDDNNGKRPSKKLKTALVSNTLPASSIIKLAVSPNNRYIVTASDNKIVRVFSVEHDSTLAELSSRTMPKRPCAIQISPDNATIICGDKFGDVYSLPLLPNPEPAPAPSTTTTAPSESFPISKPPPLEPRPFKPSATSKTVHTERNLKTLAYQQSQKNRTTSKPKEPLKFSHKLLLGHVSVLTDLAQVTWHVYGRRREYIITADRDEHIRVSRAPPQSHVIEGYCLGHEEFVSKLCVVPNHDGVLISGGGDGTVGVWDWRDFRLRRWIDLRSVFGYGHIAVSLIKILRVEEGEVLVVNCERSSVLALMPMARVLDNAMGPDEWTIVDLGHPILDLVSTQNRIIVSVDARDEPQRRLQLYKLTGGNSAGSRLSLKAESNNLLEKINAVESPIQNPKALDDGLYIIERLRKRGNAEDATEDE